MRRNRDLARNNKHGEQLKNPSSKGVARERNQVKERERRRRRTHRSEGEREEAGEEEVTTNRTERNWVQDEIVEEEEELKEGEDEGDEFEDGLCLRR